MIDHGALEAWLERANERYRADDIVAVQRPFKALMDFCEEHGCSIALGSPEADAIFNWFKAHSAHGSHHIGSLFTGAYYYDAAFWPVAIPIGFGTARLDVFKSLETMPAPIKRAIGANEAETMVLALHWSDCCDYGYGLDDIEKMARLRDRAAAFARNADQELVGAIRQVLHPKPNPKSILSFRMATEIFMKTVLVQERDLSDRDLKRLSHSIDDLATECFGETGMREFEDVAKEASAFPEVSARYDGDERTFREVWAAARVAQRAASGFARRYSDRNMRAQVLRSSPR